MSAARALFAILVLSAPLAIATGQTSPAVATDDLLPPEWEEGIAIYSEDFGMSRSAALTAVTGQERRLLFREEVATKLPKELGGFSYSPPNDLMDVFVTSPSASSAVANLARIREVEVRSVIVPFSLYELTALADSIHKGEYAPLGDLPTRASVDVTTNTVEVYVERPQDVVEIAARTDIHPAIRVLKDEDPEIVDEACTNKRDGCGRPLRGGIGVWRDGLTGLCSLGYTATGSDGSWWAVTAGHCSNTLNRGLGHGEQYFGPVRQTNNNNNGFERVDVLRARIDNPYWRAERPGGWLVNVDTNNVPYDAPTPVDYIITSRSTIAVNDIVCLSALSPRTLDSCGRIMDEFSTNNMPRVDYDACPGDSGGAWTWRTSAGNLWGFGVHEGGREGCPRFDTGDNNNSQDYSTFTAIPDLNAYWDATTGSVTLRVDQR